MGSFGPRRRSASASRSISKGCPTTRCAIHLRRNDQAKPEYRAVNPQGLVPALEIDGQTLIQSLAIIEYLDETHPEPPLLPGDRGRPGAGEGISRYRRLRYPPDQQSAGAALPRPTPMAATRTTSAAGTTIGSTPAFAPRSAARLRPAHRHFLSWRPARPCRHRARAAGRQRRALQARHVALSDDRPDLCSAAWTLPAFQAAHPDNQPDREA